MKEIIMLVDMGNSKFLFENNKGNYFLPTLDNLTDISKVENEFQKKYKLEINKLVIIEKASDYIAIKAFANYDLIDDKYDYDIINNIYPNISNVKRKTMLSKIQSKIFNETVNDSFWLGIILSVEDRTSNFEVKCILSDFLLFFSSIFCEELINYKLGEIKDKNILSKEIKKLRNLYLKKCPIPKSKEIKSIKNDMGINFDEYVFDIVIYLLNDTLIDINSRMWNKKENKSGMFNGIVMSPRKWIKNNFPDEINEGIEMLREIYIDRFLDNFENMKIKRETYSTYKLFKRSIREEEKIYILQRIGLLKILIMITDILGSGNFEEIDFFDLDKFLMKTKATVIEIIWTDKKNNILPFLDYIFANMPKEIDDDFYRINRKLRDNIHYGFYNEISENEINKLIVNQEIYLKYIINELEKSISYEFNLGHKILLTLARIQRWSSS